MGVRVFEQPRRTAVDDVRVLRRRRQDDAFLCDQTHQTLDDERVPLAAAAAFQFAQDDLARQCRTVGPGTGHGIEGIGDGQDARTNNDSCTLDTTWAKDRTCTSVAALRERHPEFKRVISGWELAQQRVWKLAAPPPDDAPAALTG